MLPAPIRNRVRFEWDIIVKPSALMFDTSGMQAGVSKQALTRALVGLEQGWSGWRCALGLRAEHHSYRLWGSCKVCTLQFLAFA